MDRQTVLPTTFYPPDSEWIPLYLAVTLPWLVVYVTVYIVIFVTAFVGNVLVIASFYMEKKLRNTTNYFFFSLAHADLLAAILGLPLVIFARLYHGSATCLAIYRQYFFTMAFMMGSVSVGHLVAITIDRFIAVTRPLHYRHLVTTRRCRLSLVVIWLIGFVFGVLPVISELDNTAEWVCGSQGDQDVIVTSHRLIAVIALPVILLVLACCYIRIFVVARQFIRRDLLHRNSTSDSNDNDEIARKSAIRVTITAVMVIGVFAICWIPSSAKFFIETYAQTTDESLFLIQTLAEMMNFMNSAINPYLYATRIPEFRRAYKKLCKLCLSSDEFEVHV